MRRKKFVQILFLVLSVLLIFTSCSSQFSQETFNENNKEEFNEVESNDVHNEDTDILIVPDDLQIHNKNNDFDTALVEYCKDNLSFYDLFRVIDYGYEIENSEFNFINLNFKLNNVYYDDIINYESSFNSLYDLYRYEVTVIEEVCDFRNSLEVDMKKKGYLIDDLILYCTVYTEDNYTFYISGFGRAPVEDLVEELYPREKN